MLKLRTVLFATCFVLLSSAAFGGTNIDGVSYSSKGLRAMARVYMACGEYGKAEPLAEKALELVEQKEGADSELSSCLIDLGYLYNDLGRLEEARVLCERGLVIQKRLLGPEHKYIAYTLRILGSVYRQQGRYEMSREVLDGAIAIIEQHYQDSPDVVAPFRADVGKLLMAEGQLERAEKCYLDVAEKLNNSYGPNHLYTAGIFGDLAKLYTLQGKYAEAEELVGHTLAVQMEVYGDRGHWVMAPTWLTMARICQGRADYTEAMRLCQKALETVEQYFDPQHPSVAEILDTMELVYQKSGEPERAITAAQRADEIRQLVQLARPVAKLTE